MISARDADNCHLINYHHGHQNTPHQVKAGMNEGALEDSSAVLVDFNKVKKIFQFLDCHHHCHPPS